MTSVARSSTLDGHTGSYQKATPEQVSETVARLRASYTHRRGRELQWRLDQLAAMERLLAERERDIVEALAADLGRSPQEAWLGDIAGAKAEASYARKHLKQWMRRHRTGLPLNMQPGRAFYQYEPLGVVLIIGPWNYPVYLTLGPLVGALAAGNCVIIKPSEYAPATGALLAKLLPTYLDKEAVAVVQGDAETAQALLAEGLDHVFFTGSPEVGKRVMASAAEHLTPVTLELGGKSPVIVLKDADLPVAARRIAWAKLLNSGQTCVAPDYLLAEKSITENLVDWITATSRKFRERESRFGMRIVNERQFDRLVAMLDGHGGTVAMGGGSDRASLTIEPTVILDPDPESPLMTEEIFGPILPVVSIESVTQAISFVNNRPRPLAAYLFSSSGDSQRRVLDEVSAGGIVLNHVAIQCLVPQLPFGGVGLSGIGAYHGEWGFQTFSHRKAVLTKPTKPDPTMLYPPYSDRDTLLLRKLF